jgi:dTMP kinase
MKYHVSFDIEFRENKSKGLYIALEGIDGVGKTTQANILKTHLAKKGTEVILTKEPTNKPPIGALINDFIKRKIKLPSVSIQYLFAADREVHQLELIEPALKKGDTVISDRTFWSSVAYGILDKKDPSTGSTSSLQAGSGQGFEKLEEAEVLLVSESILSMYHQFILPDITLYIDAKPETAYGRLSGMGRQIEFYETLEKLKNIKAGYDWLAKKFPEQIVTIDGERSVDEVSEEIIKHVSRIK